MQVILNVKYLYNNDILKKVLITQVEPKCSQ